MDKSGMFLRMAMVVLLSVTALAQDKPKAAPKTAPVISDKLRGDFFKAQADAQGAQSQLQQAQAAAQTATTAFQAVVKKAIDACGSEHQLSQDKDRELVCTDKPKTEPVKPEPAKK